MVRSRPVVIVSGQTASGKSALALELAAGLSGEIVSCDSVQVYKGFDIGSAKPSRAEQQQIPHHLIDCCRGNEQYHAARFRQDALTAIEEITSRNKQAFIVGGTTLYLSALLSGLSDYPDSDPEVRQKLQEMEAGERYRLLQEKDPRRAAALHPNDTLRIVRALEICLQTGETTKSLSDSRPPFPVLAINLCVPHAALSDSIVRRTVKMIDDGLVEEAQRLRDTLEPPVPALSSVGYLEAVQYLNGEISREQLLEKIIVATRQLAKRQRTFWRNEPVKREWRVRPDEGDSGTLQMDDEASGQRKKGMRKGFISFDISTEELQQRIAEHIGTGISGIEVWHVSIR